MAPPERRNPAGGPGNADGQHLGRGLNEHCNPFDLAAAKALKRELWIVVQAAHMVASGKRLTETDADRVHEAHQHIVRVLAAAAGREVYS